MLRGSFPSNKLDIAPLGERTIAGDIHAMRYDPQIMAYGMTPWVWLRQYSLIIQSD